MPNHVLNTDKIRKPGASKETERHVEVLLKAIDILECFIHHDRLQLKELSELTGLHKSRIMRICGTLLCKNYIKYDEQTKTYRLGPAFLVLGKRYENSNTLISLARPILRKLVNETGESSSLFVRDGHWRLCLAREEGNKPVRYIIKEGQRLQIYAGSSGKTLLAFLEENERKTLLDAIDLTPLTPNTTTDRERLERQLKEIARTGYAFTLGERSSNAAGLSAPVFDHQGKITASVSLSGPIDEFTGGKYLTFLGALLQATEQISQGLGFAGNLPSI